MSSPDTSAPAAAMDRAGDAAASLRPARRLSRPLLLAIASGFLGCGYGLNFWAVRAVTGQEERDFFAVYPVYVGLLFLGYLLGVWLTWRAGLRTAVIVIALGLTFRAAMLPTPVVLSSDVFRYLWDGRVQLAGINPYLHPPASDALASLRDPVIFRQINRPQVRTVYPPGSQALFAVLAWLAPDSLAGWRLLLLLCELSTMLLLVALLRWVGLPEGRVAVYAWAPLAVFEVAQAGHVDGAFIPLALAALLARLARRQALAGILLGGAALIKLYPVILLPVLWERRDRRLPLAFAATLILGYLPYISGAGWKATGFLPLYFSRFEDFNIGLRALLTDGIGLHGRVARAVVMVILTVAFGLALAAVTRRAAPTPEGLARGVGLAIGAYLLLLPTALHPWYVVWLLPFLPILTQAAWWLLSAGVALSYVGYTVDPSHVPAWIRAVEFGPVYALVLLNLRAGRRLAWVQPVPASKPSWRPPRMAE